MPTEVWAGRLGHQRRAGAANGVVLSATAAFVGLIQGTRHVDLIPRNFVTAVVARYIECPYLAILVADTADDLGTPPRDFSEVAQDGNTGTPRVVLSGLAAGRFVYMGAAVPFRGADFDVVATNSTGSTVLTVRHWDGGAWTAVASLSDGTSSTVSLDQDGLVTWTVPTQWPAESLQKISAKLGNTIARDFPYKDGKLHWTRWEWNQALDASVTIDAILGANESTAYAEVPSGLGTGERVLMETTDVGLSGYELLVNAGSGNMLVICSTLDGKFSVGEVK